MTLLSQNVRKFGASIIIKPSKDSIHRLLTRTRDLIKKNQAQTQKYLIYLLNPLIRGWAYYHRKVCARKTFEKIDHEVFQALWKWAKRRHPNKGLYWIKEKYFKTIGNQSWVFADKALSKGSMVSNQLFKATSLLIRRHRKIRAEANPFCREWALYFIERSAIMKGLGQR